jgi:hypothetical protein
MILIPVDEGYAYDYLAILQVKYERGVIPKSEFDDFSNYLRNALGPGAHSIILSSHEYKECVRVNLATFDRVDDAKEDKVKASVVHNLNFERFKAKTELQRRFFPNSKISEKKN